MRRVVFLPAARTDLRTALEWYLEQQPGLDRAFRAEIDRLLDSVAENPRLYPVVRRNVHRAMTQRFPYKIFYTASDNEVLVLAVRHHSRRLLTGIE